MYDRSQHILWFRRIPWICLWLANEVILLSRNQHPTVLSMLPIITANGCLLRLLGFIESENTILGDRVGANGDHETVFKPNRVIHLVVLESLS